MFSLILGFGANVQGKPLVRIISTVMLALFVAVGITLFSIWIGPEEIRANLSMGAGPDRSSYTEYPIKTYWFLGSLLFVWYTLFAIVGLSINEQTIT